MNVEVIRIHIQFFKGFLRATLSMDLIYLVTCYWAGRINSSRREHTYILLGLVNLLNP